MKLFYGDEDALSEETGDGPQRYTDEFMSINKTDWFESEYSCFLGGFLHLFATKILECKLYFILFFSNVTLSFQMLFGFLLNVSLKSWRL